MFSGIITAVGGLESARATPARADSAPSLTLEIQTPYRDLALGESVAVNGVCLTVAELPRPETFIAFVSAETLVRTNLGKAVPGARLNLERSLTLSDRLSGHLVQGHVDGIATFTHAEAVGQEPDVQHFVTFKLPPELATQCVPKGSIAINGVSLTINELEDTGRVGITLVPHTWAHTNLSRLRLGDPVNVEIDILGKYIGKYVARAIERLGSLGSPAP